MSTKELVVCKNFKLVKKLGTGAFGEIYLAQNRSNQDEKLAAKLEPTNTKFPQLYFEAKMYKYLTSSGSVQGIPKIHAMTTQGQYNIMLMDLLGQSIQDIFVDHNKKLSLKSVLMIAQQMIDRIQCVHDKQVIHRDIKPDNFLMGVGKNSHVLYIVDFGLSKKYTKDNQHIPYKQGKQLTGTARYASISTHMGIQQARRDDIQSIGYVIMYLLRGILPWQNMKAKDTKTKYKMILQKKMSTPAEVLCKGFPSQLATFINYAKNLKFEQKPDYLYLKKLIDSAKKSNKIQTDYIYDWTNKTQNVTVISSQKKVSNVEQKVETKVFAQNNKQKNPISNTIEKKEIPSNKNIDSKKLIDYKNLGVSGGNILKNTKQNNDPQFKVAKTTITGTYEMQSLGSNIMGPKISVIKR